ncbi:substrate-binding periplasmic protein [Niveispirillum sp. KHB5.9]|uniref:substrate-binding periplasmic protein n=1 Tax=Niveispirillum sp. KHB5.9 TaxID=3400269 RepID=UPI003A8BB4BF
MKTPSPALLAAIAALFALPAWLPAAAGEGAGGCHMQFVWAEMPPYQTLGGDGKPTGIDIELVAEAARRMPCTIDWELAPRARAVLLVQEGKADAIVGVARTAEREAFGIFSQPIREGRNVLIVRKGDAKSFPYNSLTELSASGFRLGVTSGTKYSQEFENLSRGGALADNIVTVQNGESAMAMLLRDRIDGFLDGYRIAINRAEQMGMRGDIDVHPMFVNEQKAFTLFSRTSGINPATITRFNAVMLGMQTDGTTNRIISNYGS